MALFNFVQGKQFENKTQIFNSTKNNWLQKQSQTKKIRHVKESDQQKNGRDRINTQKLLSIVEN